jgi:hypothetical protein
MDTPHIQPSGHEDDLARAFDAAWNSIARLDERLEQFEARVIYPAKLAPVANRSESSR